MSLFIFFEPQLHEKVSGKKLMSCILRNLKTDIQTDGHTDTRTGQGQRRLLRTPSDEPGVQNGTFLKKSTKNNLIET